MLLSRGPWLVSAMLLSALAVCAAETAPGGTEELYRVDIANIGSCYDADLVRMLEAHVYAYLEPGVLDVFLARPPDGLHQRERIVLIGDAAGGDVPAAGSMSLRSQVLGRDVLLAFDSVLRDPAGRLYCYVYLPDDGTCVNLKLIRDGLARLDRAPPSFQFFQEFDMSEQQAREKKKGIWAR